MSSSCSYCSLTGENIKKDKYNVKLLTCVDISVRPENWNWEAVTSQHFPAYSLPRRHLKRILDRPICKHSFCPQFRSKGGNFTLQRQQTFQEQKFDAPATIPTPWCAQLVVDSFGVPRYIPRSELCIVVIPHTRDNQTTTFGASFKVHEQEPASFPKLLRALRSLQSKADQRFYAISTVFFTNLICSSYLISCSKAEGSSLTSSIAGSGVPLSVKVLKLDFGLPEECTDTEEMDRSLCCVPGLLPWGTCFGG